MPNKVRIKLIIGLIINIVIVGLVIYCLTNFIGYILKGSHDNRFRYFTNISNLTVGLVAVFNIVFLTLSLIKNELVYPRLLSIIKFMALSMTTLTFFVVLCFLTPLTSFYEMYSNVKFLTHLVVPLLAAISYMFFEEDYIFEWRYSLLGIAPPIIYSTIYVTCVVFVKTWPDMYQVNKQGLWYVFVLGTIVVAFALSQGLYFVKKRITKKPSC